MSSTTLPVCPKTGSTSPSLTVHLCLHTAPGNRECALSPPERAGGPPCGRSAASNEADRWALDAGDVLGWLDSAAAGTDDVVRLVVEER